MTTPSTSVPLVTIVMYHFVRSASMASPRLHTLEPSAFREQLRYLRRYYSPVRLGDVVDAANGSTTLPARPVVLTFDDGYRDHYVNVFPLLVEHGMPATFFVARSALVDRHVLDTNKVQFILAAVADPESLVVTIERAIAECRDADVATVSEYRARWWVPSRVDDPRVAYIKRMLQHGLPDQVRRRLVSALFERYVTSDEAAFAAGLYLTVDEAREMRGSGMDFGGHGDRHVPLTVLGQEAQAREIDGALQALDAIGVSRRPFAYSYVKGEHDATSLDLLRARGCAVALTTREDVAQLGVDDLLTLPRIDTNCLPVDGDADPNGWTAKVLETSG